MPATALPPLAVTWSWTFPVVRPCAKHPQGMAGLLEISVTQKTGKVVTEPYVAAPIVAEDGDGQLTLLGWSLTKADGTRYDIDPTYTTDPSVIPALADAMEEAGHRCWAIRIEESWEQDGRTVTRDDLEVGPLHGAEARERVAVMQASGDYDGARLTVVRIAVVPCTTRDEYGEVLGTKLVRA